MENIRERRKQILDDLRNEKLNEELIDIEAEDNVLMLEFSGSVWKNGNKPAGHVWRSFPDAVRRRRYRGKCSEDLNTGRNIKINRHG